MALKVKKQEKLLSTDYRESRGSSFLELLSVLYASVTWLWGGSITLCVLLFLLVYTKFYWISILYFTWTIYDKDTRHRGGRSSRFRNWVGFKYFRDYFPLKLVKTADLDPSRNYLLCSYPHGVLCISQMGCIGTDAAGFKDLFPGIEPHMATLDVLFLLPYLRDFLLCLGFISASDKSLDYVLSRPEGGHAPVLILGGGSEVLNAHPGMYKFNVKNRKGFARLALKHGAPLVPVISFGENDAFRQFHNPEGSWLRLVQNTFYKVCGASLTIPYGSFVLVPLRRRITLVVGRPIEVEKIQEPTKDQIEQLRDRFIKEIVEMFDREKYKYVDDPENTFVEII